MDTGGEDAPQKRSRRRGKRGGKKKEPEASSAAGELTVPAANDVAEQPDKLVVGDVVNFLFVRKNKATKVLYSSSAVVVTVVCSPSPPMLVPDADIVCRLPRRMVRMQS